MAKSKFTSIWLLCICGMVCMFFISGKSIKRPQPIPAKMIRSETPVDYFSKSVSIMMDYMGKRAAASAIHK